MAKWKRKVSNKPKKTATDHYENVANELIERIKEGTAPWQKPWEPGEEPPSPFNPVTGNKYSGGNRLTLEMAAPDGGSDPRWLTYKGAQSVGAQVRKGERATPIVYWKFEDEKTKLDAQGKPVRNDQGEIVKEKVKLERPMCLFSSVFHASQIDGLEPWNPPEKAPQSDFERHERCEAILANSQADIRHESGDRAFYRPSTDSITLPEKGQFKSPDAYYATALHELGHWTGHESRLDRDLAHSFGSEGYAKEELRAEISSMMIARELGVGHDPGQHASYVESWVKVLQDDPSEIFKAAKDADKITAFVMEFDLEKENQSEVTSKDQVHEKEAEAPEVAPEEKPEETKQVSEPEEIADEKSPSDFAAILEETPDTELEHAEEDWEIED